MSTRLENHLDTERKAKLDAIVNDPDVIDVKATALFLNTPERTIQQLAQRGELPGRKVGRRWQFSRRRLLEWLEEE